MGAMIDSRAPLTAPLVTRREAMTALASAAALPLAWSACGGDRAPTPPAAHEAAALRLLDELADDLLRLSPESATSLGIDTGARAALKLQLADRSAEGQQRVAMQLRAGLAQVDAVD